MASVNANADDLISISVNPEDQIESDLTRWNPGSGSRSYDEGGEDEDLLANIPENDDDRALVACLAPKDR